MSVFSWARRRCPACRWMCRVPFTAAGLARAIKGVELAGRHVVGVKPDGTLIVAEKPIDTTSLVPQIEQDDPSSVWADKLG
jgi:hypothetical protein